MAAKHSSPKEATLFEWGLLALITAFGGSSFVMIRTAVATIPPTVIAPMRLWIGACLLYGLMRAAGRRLPPFIIKAHGKWRIRRVWIWMIWVGAVGYTAPFFLFPWAQQYVESGLAGVYMAFMPIWTVGLAYAFAGETLTRRKIIGFILGFAGVLALLGPDVLKGALTSDVRAQAGLLLATFLYAASAVMSRRAPPIRPRVFAAGLMIAAAIMATPALLFSVIHPGGWAPLSLASVVGLGVFPTGLNGVLIIMTIRRAGAGFMALSNYFTPLWALAMGAAVFHEKLEWSVMLALGLILAGVAISQRGRRRPAIEAGDALAEDIAPMVDDGAQTKI